LKSEIALGEDSTPDEKSKKRGNAKQDTKATPAKKRRDSVEGGNASSSSAPIPTNPAKEAALAPSVSRAELAVREEPESNAAKPKAARRKKTEVTAEGNAPGKEAAEPKRGKKAKPEGPYTKFKEAGTIPEQSVERKELPPDAKLFKAVAWNVGGLRSFARNRSDALPELVRHEKPDVLGIMEHKMQEGAADTDSTMKDLLERLPDYEASLVNFSTVKKGYSGTLVFLRKDGPKPLSVEPCELSAAQDEGRLIVMEFDALFVVLAYVPNSGDGLKRLDERIEQWDLQLREKLQQLAAKKSPLS
jgi:hypothetical protein